MNRNNIYKAAILTKDELDSLSSIYTKVIEDCGISVDYHSYIESLNGYSPAFQVYMFLSGENNVTIGKFDASTVLFAIIPTEALKELEITPSKNDKVIYSSKPFYVRKISYLDKNGNLSVDFDHSFLCECELVQKTDLLRSAKLL